MHAEPGRARRARQGRDRGATLTEYALVFTFFVVIAIGVLQYLTTAAEDQVANQADCVSTRPPPPACQVPALDTTTTLVGAPTTPPPQTIPTGGVAAWTSNPTGSGMKVTGGSVTIKVNSDVDAPPVEGAKVFFQVTCSPTGNFYLDPVTTGADGVAALPAGVECPTGSTGATVTAYRIDSEPIVSTLPSPKTVTLS